MSKSKTPSVVSSKTTFNTVVDTKISRKELVDMILEEQEANLEDALEAAQEEYYKTNKAYKAAIDAIEGIVIDVITALPSTKKHLKEAKSYFKNSKIDLSVSAKISYKSANERCYLRDTKLVKDKNNMYLTLSANIFIWAEKNNRLNNANVHVANLNKTDLLKIKSIKKEIDSVRKLYAIRELALANLQTTDDAKTTLKKKGKRARAQFTRELLKNTVEGQVMLEQLDAIKKNTQKLLK